MSDPDDPAAVRPVEPRRRGRPPAAAPRVAVTTWLPRPTLEALERAATRRGESRSKTIAGVLAIITRTDEGAV